MPDRPEPDWPGRELSVPALDGPVALGVAWRQGGTLRGGRVETTDDVADHFRGLCRRHIEGLAKRQAKPYAPDADVVATDEYLVVPRAELDATHPLLVLLDSVPARDPLDPDDLPRRSLLLSAYLFAGATGPAAPGPTTLVSVAFVRKANTHETAHTGRLFTRLADTLTRIDEPVFAFDDKIDLVVTPERLLVSNAAAFELLFKDDTFLTRHIPEWIHSLASVLPVNADAPRVLAEHCRRNTRLRRRLEAIHRRGHLRLVTVERVRAEAVRQGLDPTALVVDGVLRFDDASVDDLLRLLNEDLLVGGLSGDRFTVERKSARRGG